jgi:hypothetical protein
MNSLHDRQTMESIAAVLGQVRTKGARVWSENGRLRYKAPLGALSTEDLDALRLYKNQIVSLLESSAEAKSSEPKLQPRSRGDRIPLTFVQLAHWHAYDLGHRSSRCLVSARIRLSGRLNFEALRASVAVIVQRHEALRTRMVVVDGRPMQVVSEFVDTALKTYDLTTVTRHRRNSMLKRVLRKRTSGPLNVTVDPLFSACLINLGENEHVLTVGMEHIISDQFSLAILLRELLSAYEQAAQGREIALPAIPIQLGDYAVWQADAIQLRMQQHSTYWAERLNTWQRLRFPADHTPAEASRRGWGWVPVKVSKELTSELRDWCRERHTTLVMCAFTVYIALVLRWCNAREGVFLFETNGRANPQIENTIGYFASVLYLHVKLRDNDTYVDLLARVTEEYCRAYEHADCSYIEAQVPRRDFTRNTCFNWFRQIPTAAPSRSSSPSSPSSDGSNTGLTYSEMEPDQRSLELILEDLDRDTEPMTALLETDDGIRGAIQFPFSRFSADTMARLGRCFQLSLEEVLKRPQDRLVEVIQDLR